MFKFKFNITVEDIDTHVKNSFTEEEKEFFKNVTFVPFNVNCNEDMNIEVTAVGVLDIKEAEEESNTETIDN